MTGLAQFQCIPCRGGEPTLTDDEIASLKPEAPDWLVVERDGILRLERLFKFKNFVQALEFTNRVGELAEAAGPSSGHPHRVGQGDGHLVDPQDQRAAPQRFHHGGQDRPALPAASLVNGLP